MSESASKSPSPMSVEEAVRHIRTEIIPYMESIAGDYPGEPDFTDRDSLTILLAAYEESQKDIKQLIEVAHKHGWNGVENSKILWRFFDNALSDSHLLDTGDEGTISIPCGGSVTITPRLIRTPRVKIVAFHPVPDTEKVKTGTIYAAELRNDWGDFDGRTNLYVISKWIERARTAISTGISDE